MSDLTMPAHDRRTALTGAVVLALVAAHWLMSFYYAPIDANMGQVYRIIFLHVPCAAAAFSSAAVLMVFSLIGLFKRSEAAIRLAKATCEVGLMFTILVLATGSIWGKPTWGTWWTWDARLTTTFLLALLYAGWLLTYSAMAPGMGRVKTLSVLGIIIFIDVPIIYQSVNWWRTLHQPQSILRPGGPSMDGEILYTLLIGIAVMLLCSAWMIYARGRNLALRDELEAASYAEMRG